MARTSKLTAVVPVAMTPAWRDRLRAVADHERTQVPMAEVIRDCIEAALPGFELALGIRNVDDLDDDELQDLGLERKAEPAREDRAAGCFGAAPRQG